MSINKLNRLMRRGILASVSVVAIVSVGASGSYNQNKKVEEAKTKIQSAYSQKAKPAAKAEVGKRIKSKPGEFIAPDFKDLKSTKLGQLEYWTLKEGKGQKPAKGQRVKVNYGGWLQSGKIFDSSYSRNEPFIFNLGGGVITGWNMMVAEMTRGQVLVVKIPPGLAYGRRDLGSIPPNSTLYFQIELLDFY